MVTLTYENIYRARIERTLEELTQHETRSNTDLANAIGMHPSTCTRTLNSLIRAGLVARKHHGTYMLGFDPSSKEEFRWYIPGLNSAPNTVMARQANGHPMWFWLDAGSDVAEIQPFGAFSEFCGMVRKNKSGMEVIDGWKRENASLWSKLKSFCTGRT